jgi:hypothetical protein
MEFKKLPPSTTAWLRIGSTDIDDERSSWNTSLTQSAGTAFLELAGYGWNLE